MGFNVNITDKGVGFICAAFLGTIVATVIKAPAEKIGELVSKGTDFILDKIDSNVKKLK